MLLSPSQKAILTHLLTEGDDVPANIAEAADLHRNSVSRAAKPLKENDLIRNKGHGVYTLTEQGRQEAREHL
jgi:Mn-dependent DtxR family transcriptional regulator